MKTFLFSAINSPSGRAHCQECGGKICKDEQAVEILHRWSGDRRSYHVSCMEKILRLMVDSAPPEPRLFAR